MFRPRHPLLQRLAQLRIERLQWLRVVVLERVRFRDTLITDKDPYDGPEDRREPRRFGIDLQVSTRANGIKKKRDVRITLILTTPSLLLMSDLLSPGLVPCLNGVRQATFSALHLFSSS